MCVTGSKGGSDNYLTGGMNYSNFLLSFLPSFPPPSFLLFPLSHHFSLQIPRGPSRTKSSHVPHGGRLSLPSILHVSVCSCQPRSNAAVVSGLLWQVQRSGEGEGGGWESVVLLVWCGGSCGTTVSCGIMECMLPTEGCRGLCTLSTAAVWYVTYHLMPVR